VVLSIAIRFMAYVMHFLGRGEGNLGKDVED